MYKKMNKKQRYCYLDNLGGLLICYMIFNHVLLMDQIDCGIDNIWLEPLQFFMFWFFFKSGMFYTPKNCKLIIAHESRKLLKPLLVYSLVGHVVECFKLCANGDYNWKHYLLTPLKEFLLNGSVVGNQPLWFLFSLFFVKLIYNELYQWKFKPALLFCIGCAVSAILFYVNIEGLPIYFANIPLGIGIYSLGYMMREWQFNKVVLLLSFILYLGIMVICPSHLIFGANSLNKGGCYVFAIVYSVAGCIFFNNLFRKIPNCTILQFVGKNSMTYYVVHWIVINICWLFLIIVYPVSGVIVFSVMSMSSFIIPTIIVNLKSRIR